MCLQQNHKGPDFFFFPIVGSFSVIHILKFGKPLCYSFFINLTTFTRDFIKHNLMCLFETNHTLYALNSLCISFGTLLLHAHVPLVQILEGFWLSHLHITPTQSHSLLISILPYFLFYSATVTIKPLVSYF